MGSIQCISKIYAPVKHSRKLNQKEIDILHDLRKYSYKSLTKGSIVKLMNQTGFTMEQCLSYKFCSRCNKFLHRDYFFKSNITFQGLSSECKECKSNMQKTNYNNNKSFCVYKHINSNGECIYVGLSESMDKRTYGDLKSYRHKDEVDHVLYCALDNKTIMKIYELYYINKLNPRYNIKDKRHDDVSSLGLSELKFIKY